MYRAMNFGRTHYLGAPKIQRVVIKCANKTFREYYQRQKAVSVSCTNLYAGMQWTNCITQLKEFEDKYISCMLRKVVMYFRGWLHGYAYDAQDTISGASKHFFDFGNHRYLWHYNYDNSYTEVKCDSEYINTNGIEHVRDWPKGRKIKHKLTWYFKPKEMFYPVGGKFSTMEFSVLAKGQMSDGTNNVHKVVCFAPVLRKIEDEDLKAGKQENGYSCFTDITMYYHFSFAARTKTNLYVGSKVDKPTVLKEASVPSPVAAITDKLEKLDLIERLD